MIPEPHPLRLNHVLYEYPSRIPICPALNILSDQIPLTRRPNPIDERGPGSFDEGDATTPRNWFRATRHGKILKNESFHLCEAQRFRHERLVSTPPSAMKSKSWDSDAVFFAHHYIANAQLPILQHHTKPHSNQIMSLPGTDLLTVTQVSKLMQLMESLQPELGARETQEKILSDLEDSRQSIGQKQTFIGLTEDHEKEYERADLAVEKALARFEELNKVLKAKKETVGWYDIMGSLVSLNRSH